jgi:hypothetical protein
MNRLLFSLSMAAALWSAACSSGGPNIQPPPPAGKYGVSNLKGTYAFTTSGEVCAGCTVAATPMARAGSFIADGMGGITGGVYDVVTQGGASSTISINNNSSYTVNADGRGTLTFNVTSNGAPTSINFGIVLTSISDGGVMIDETSNTIQASTGSGNFVLQSTAAFQVSTVSGNYVFDFTGFDGNTSGPFPESLVGQFAVTNGGQITTGFEDANDGLGLSNGSMAPGTLAADPVNMSISGRGTAVIEGQDYAFYIVDSTRVRFISSNTLTGNAGPMLSGDAVLQGNTIPANLSAISGSFAFLVGGSDSVGNGITRVGRLTATGNALSKMLMDVNDGSNEVQFDNLSNGSISSYDPATGRGQFSLQDSNSQVYTFVFYLSSQNGGVLQDVSPSNTAGQARVVADGSINLQSGGPFTGSNISGTYAMNWSGLVTAGGNIANTDEEDMLGQLTISNLSLSGTSDVFQFTSRTLTPNLSIGTTGLINFNGGDGTGSDVNHTRVDMNVNFSGNKPIDLVVYIVNPQLAFFANRDNSGTQRIVAGILKAQQ